MTVNWIGIHLTGALLTKLPNTLLMVPRRIAFLLNIWAVLFNNYSSNPLIFTDKLDN